MVAYTKRIEKDRENTWHCERWSYYDDSKLVATSTPCSVGGFNLYSWSTIAGPSRGCFLI